MNGFLRRNQGSKFFYNVLSVQTLKSMSLCYMRLPLSGLLAEERLGEKHIDVLLTQLPKLFNIKEMSNMDFQGCGMSPGRQGIVRMKVLLLTNKQEGFNIFLSYNMEKAGNQ